MDPEQTDERTYHGTINRLVRANEKVLSVTRWHLGYPTQKNMERLNQLIPLTHVERDELDEAISLLQEVRDKSEADSNARR